MRRSAGLPYVIRPYCALIKHLKVTVFTFLHLLHDKSQSGTDHVVWKKVRICFILTSMHEYRVSWSSEFVSGWDIYTPQILLSDQRKSATPPSEPHKPLKLAGYPAYSMRQTLCIATRSVSNTITMETAYTLIRKIQQKNTKCILYNVCKSLNLPWLGWLSVNVWEVW